MPCSHSATRQHSTIVAGGPGSRSKTIIVGVSSASARCSCVCSSSAARLASQTSVGRSLQTQNSTIFFDSGTGAIATQSGRCEGHCFSKKLLSSTPLGKRTRVSGRRSRCGRIAGAIAV